MDPIKENKEPESQGFIKLVEPDSHLEFLRSNTDGEYHFECPDQLIPSLGTLALWGSKFNTEFEVGDDDKVIFLKGNQVIKGKAKEHKDFIKQMFELAISQDGKVPDGMKCRLNLPGILDLIGDLELNEDDNQPDPMKRYWSICSDWKDQEGTDYRFFAPADPKFLSQLQFRFYTDLSSNESE